jgi:hypothetical protein
MLLVILLSKVWEDEAGPDALLKTYTCDVVVLLYINEGTDCKFTVS